jgi:DNA-binding CsgD family transcriptional regulator
MTTIELSSRDRSMLELLSLGISNKAIAAKLGYQHGTTRVYLHALYRKLGVASKTAAVVWYVDYLKANSARKAQDAAAPVSLDESVGDLALRADLFTALGAMSLFLGAYGKLWQVAERLKGVEADSAADAPRRQSRSLWEALLKGDFAYGKRLFDGGEAARQMLDSPGDGVLIALLLQFGGYSGAAGQVTSQLARMKRGTRRVSSRDMQLLEAVRAVEGRKDAALERVYRAAVEAPAQTPARHLALAALYHAYRAGGDVERAKATAEALWAEAEASRRNLEAMGERPLAREAAPPRPATHGAKVSVPRRKVALATR